MKTCRIVALNTPMPVRPHYADTFAMDGADCALCCEMAVEAWERMTHGGVTARYGKSPDYPVIIASVSGRLKWVKL